MRLLPSALVIGCATACLEACAGPAPDDGAVARIAVSPREGCDFAAIALGSLESCTVTVANEGTAPLEVTAAIEGDDGFDLIGRIADDVIAPQRALDLLVELAAAEPRAYDGALRFTSNDAEAPVVDVPLHGIALEPPQCVARVKSVNGAADAAGAVVGDDVVLTLEDSQPATVTGAITSWSWAVRQSPGSGGPAALSDEHAADTAVAVDDAGNYVVCGAVVDDQGLASHNECCAAFDVVGPRALMAQVSSSSPVGLHLVSADEQGVYCVADVTGAAIDDARARAALEGAAAPRGAACVNGRDTHNASGTVVAVDDVGTVGAGAPLLVALTSTAPATASVRLYTFGAEMASLTADVDGYREVAVAELLDGAVCVDDLGDAADACAP